MLLLRVTREIKRDKREEYLAVVAKVKARYVALGSMSKPSSMHKPREAMSISASSCRLRPLSWNMR